MRVLANIHWNQPRLRSDVARWRHRPTPSRHILANGSRAVRNREALKQFVSQRDVAPFGRDATGAYGRLRYALEKKGLPIGSWDLLIAAHAVSLDVRLITHNVREFGRVPGLRIEDWAQGT